jgi:hypothetical protein
MRNAMFSILLPAASLVLAMSALTLYSVPYKRQ